ncbi:cytochrome b-c1 complex subunit 9 isoform X1 [Neodiprion virginianus]|uniref:cytochrome b-c1 complex subunit 9 isoform X1 n=1 Tax=Neodiprion virginianus TaxID=2961670 RepID=UPI001EE765F0|nr:cytochrome b-c1 complex subunit 9 isoform X1 [Neodiprion virginianus]
MHACELKPRQISLGSLVVCSAPEIYIKMAGIASTVYNVICRRSSTFALAIIAGTFVFERTFDTISNQIFDSYNKGKQWKDIKHKYEKE